MIMKTMKMITITILTLCLSTSIITLTLPVSLVKAIDNQQGCSSSGDTPSRCGDGGGYPQADCHAVNNNFDNPHSVFNDDIGSPCHGKH